MSSQERPDVTRNRLIQEHHDYELKFGNIPSFNLLMEKVSSTPMCPYSNFCYKEKDDKSSDSFFINNKSYIYSLLLGKFLFVHLNSRPAKLVTIFLPFYTEKQNKKTVLSPLVTFCNFFLSGIKMIKIKNKKLSSFELITPITYISQLRNVKR